MSAANEWLLYGGDGRLAEHGLFSWPTGPLTAGRRRSARQQPQQQQQQPQQQQHSAPSFGSWASLGFGLGGLVDMLEREVTAMIEGFEQHLPPELSSPPPSSLPQSRLPTAPESAPAGIGIGAEPRPPSLRDQIIHPDVLRQERLAQPRPLPSEPAAQINGEDEASAMLDGMASIVQAIFGLNPGDALPSSSTEGNDRPSVFSSISFSSTSSSTTVHADGVRETIITQTDPAGRRTTTRRLVYPDGRVSETVESSGPAGHSAGGPAHPADSVLMPGKTPNRREQAPSPSAPADSTGPAPLSSVSSLMRRLWSLAGGGDEGSPKT